MVSSSRLERSSVTPEGTVSADKTIVAQSAWDTLASEYPLDPEKVQLVARLPLALDKSGAGVGRGAGAAKAEAARLAARRADRRVSIVIKAKAEWMRRWDCWNGHSVLASPTMTYIAKGGSHCDSRSLLLSSTLPLPDGGSSQELTVYTSGSLALNCLIREPSSARDHTSSVTSCQSPPMKLSRSHR